MPSYFVHDFSIPLVTFGALSYAVLATGKVPGTAWLAIAMGVVAFALDLFDAMRSQRKYQAAQPTDRILEVLKHEDGAQFDRHLVRRFVQLVGP